MRQDDAYRSMVNTARDLADSFNRFERDMARFRRMAVEVDDKDAVMLAVMEGCDSPKRRAAIETINERIARTRDSRMNPPELPRESKAIPEEL